MCIAGIGADVGQGRCCPPSPRAQEPWPSRPITLVVPFPPGGQADLAARPIAQALEKLLGRRRRRRQPRRCRRGARQCRRRTRGARRLHAADDAVVACGAAGIVAAVRPRAILRGDAARARRARAGRPDPARGPGGIALEDAEGLRRGREGPARHDPLRLVGALWHAACRDGDVCDLGRHQAAACALSRRGPGADRPAVGPAPGHRLGARACSSRMSSPARCACSRTGARAASRPSPICRPSRNSATPMSSSTSGPACSRPRACPQAIADAPAGGDEDGHGRPRDSQDLRAGRQPAGLSGRGRIRRASSPPTAPG